MFVKSISSALLAGCLFITGCGSQDAQRYPNTHQPAPQIDAMAGAAESDRSLQQRDLQPGAVRENGRPQPPLLPPGNRQNAVAATGREKGAPLPAYDAQQMLITFAQTYLGIDPTVMRAQGASGDLVLPPTVSQQMNGTVALAGQTSGGLINVAGNRGAAQVAVGGGSISGDLEADISNAALGAYSLLLPGVARPTDENAARSLIIGAYPALVNADLQLQSSTTTQGYLFRVVTTTQGIDWQTKQVTVVAQVIVAGVSGQGRASVVWVVVGNGTFAAMV